MSLSTIPQALDALRAGRPVIVADDEDRENEGDVILSAQLATPEWIAWTVRWSSGFLCAPMPGDWADRLDLPPATSLRAVVEGSGIMLRPDFTASLRWTRPGGHGHARTASSSRPSGMSTPTTRASGTAAMSTASRGSTCAAR